MLVILIVLAVVGFIAIQGLARIPADPPHIGVRTWFGKRVQDAGGRAICIKEGWHWFLLRPYVMGFIPVDVTRKQMDVSIKTRTPDRAEVEVVISITFRPTERYLVEYLNSGGEKGVTKIFDDEAKERGREYVEGVIEGPRDWRELYNSRLEMTSVLVKRLVGNGLPNIPDLIQEIPTYILMLYFDKPRLPYEDNMDEEEKEKVPLNVRPWARDDWEMVRDIMIRVYGAGEPSNVRAAVAARKEEIRKLRDGTGNVSIPDLGITLERLNVSDIQVTGKAKDAADREAEEREQRDAEILELKHVTERARVLREQLVEIFTELRPDENLLQLIIDMIQVERGKATREIKTYDFPPRVIEAITGIIRGGRV